MDQILKHTIKIAGYIFSGLLLVFTGMQTFAFLLANTSSHITAATGLALFEGGMLYWWNVFKREAEGAVQMAIAGVMFLLSLLLVVTAVSLHLGAIDVGFLGDHTAQRIIIAAATLNLIAKLVYPLAGSRQIEELNERAGSFSLPKLTITKPEAKAIPAGNRADEMEVIPVAYPNGREEMSVPKD